MAKYVPIYESFWEVASDLPDEQRLRLYDAVTLYGFRGVYPKFDPETEKLLNVAFKLIVPNIDAAIRRSENGKKGGRPRSEKQ